MYDDCTEVRPGDMLVYWADTHNLETVHIEQVGYDKCVAVAVRKVRTMIWRH